jgi:hypothetical protein
MVLGERAVRWLERAIWFCVGGFVGALLQMRFPMR